MIYVVMGMSKSGTTLVSKTLHESGINMYPGKTGNYKQSKYEDPEMIKILLKMFNTKKLQSLYIPEKIIINDKIRNDIKNYISKRSCCHNWGFKQPWVTLAYLHFLHFLPEHTAIGIQRSPAGLINHWKKRGKKVNEKKVKYVQNIYNTLMQGYGISILSFENFIKNGPGELEKITGLRLKDVRS